MLLNVIHTCVLILTVLQVEELRFVFYINFTDSNGTPYVGMMRKQNGRIGLSVHCSKSHFRYILEFL